MYKIYEITFGDTLDSIAKKFNTTIFEMNKLNTNMNIVPGELIVVPNYSDDEYFKIYTIKNGDTLYSIAHNNNISLNDLVSINGLDKDNYIYPGQEILIPKDNVMVLITDNDDTLDSVSNKMNIDKDTIVNQNDPIYLLPNQLIVYKK